MTINNFYDIIMKFEAVPETFPATLPVTFPVTLPASGPLNCAAAKVPVSVPPVSGSEALAVDCAAAAAERAVESSAEPVPLDCGSTDGSGFVEIIKKEPL